MIPEQPGGYPQQEQQSGQIRYISLDSISPESIENLQCAFIEHGNILDRGLQRYAPDDMYFGKLGEQNSLKLVGFWEGWTDFITNETQNVEVLVQDVSPEHQLYVVRHKTFTENPFLIDSFKHSSASRNKYQGSEAALIAQYPIHNINFVPMSFDRNHQAIFHSGIRIAIKGHAEAANLQSEIDTLSMIEFLKQNNFKYVETRAGITISALASYTDKLLPRRDGQTTNNIRELIPDPTAAGRKIPGISINNYINILQVLEDIRTQSTAKAS